MVGRITGRRQRPDPATFAGKGKVEEIGTRKADSAAELVIFDHPLSGVQHRNLEQALGCRVVDRTSLIVDIFAQRARSSEGKLQVEHAQLKHMATRLVGGWTHLERQKGGIGLHGPGETQLETDRRLIARRGVHGALAGRDTLQRMVKRERTLLIAAAAVAALVIVYVAVRGDARPTAGPGAATGARAGRSTGEGALPRVGLERVRPATSRPAVGRDIFDFGAATRPESAAGQALPPPPPVDPTPTPEPTPTPLPPLTVKYIGSVERKGLRLAIFMTEKKEIVSGQAGDTVMNRFRIVRIGLESVDVQQVGADQVQRLPLKGN